MLVCRNLGNNIFPRLPKNGLKNVLHLKTFNNPKLRDFPPPETFPRIQVFVNPLIDWNACIQFSRWATFQFPESYNTTLIALYPKLREPLLKLRLVVGYRYFLYPWNWPASESTSVQVSISEPIWQKTVMVFPQLVDGYQKRVEVLFRVSVGKLWLHGSSASFFFG